MKIPGYLSGPFDRWMSDAFTVFLNGFIAGTGSGSVVGTGAGITVASTTLGDNYTPLQQFGIALACGVASAVANGWKRVLVWHDAHPVPNPFRNTPPEAP